MNHTKSFKLSFFRLVSVVLTVCMAVCLLPITAGAEETDATNYVALGDSISTGYGLAEGEKSFAQLVAEENSFNLTCLAEDGATTATLLTKLQQPETIAAVSAANVVTITIGGNDFVNAFYEFIANNYNEANPDANKTPEDIKNDILGNNFQILNFALGIAADFGASAEGQSAIQQVQTNFPAIILGIKKLNPQADIIITNQYNPYEYAAGTLTGTDELTLKFKALEAALDYAIQTINTPVADLCLKSGCLVADTYTAFKDAEQNPTNAVFSLMGLSLDFHPNAYGHSLIAGTVNSLIADESEPEYAIGDVNGDSYINITDATAIQKFIALIPVEGFREDLADVNNDGEININDATLIQISLLKI